MKKIFIILLLLLLTGCSQPVDLGEQRLGAIASIQDIVEIGEIEKTIDFTDKNEGENFIIKTDNKDYYSLGGGIMSYFSITNISTTDQDAYVVFSLGKEQTVNNIERFNGNQEVITYTKATATTTSEKIITKIDTWNNISFDSYDVSKTELTRKDTLNREINKVFKDNFRIGETKYYMASIQVPNGITENEWFIEVFGSDYGHLDPNNWTYEQKFNDLNTADLNGQDSWTADGQIDVVETGTPYEGTKHVYYSSDAGSYSMNRTITAVTYGTYYVSIKPNDDTQYIYHFGINNNLDNDIYCLVGLTKNKIQCYNGNTSTFEEVGTYSANTWFRMGIAFEYTAGGYESLSQRHYKVSMNDGAFGAEKRLNKTTGTSFNKMNFSSTVGNKTFYLDYISYEYGGAVADPCEYSGTGDWYVNYSDNCYITSDVYINGSFNLINDGAGSFGTIANISALIEEGTAKFNVDGNLPIQCNRPNTDCLSGHN